MGIVGIGCDIVAVARIARLWSEYGATFARHFLGPEELEQLAKVPNKVQFLAKRFAVKEAAVKALGTGVQFGMLLKDSRISNDESGKPQLHFYGVNLEKASSIGVTKTHVTISDEKEHAIAFVVLED